MGETYLETLKSVSTDLLDIAYLDKGSLNKKVIVLLHGFPYGIEAYSKVWPILSSSGFRVLVPFLRGYGSTRFLGSDTLRSGEQAAIGSDLIEFLDRLNIDRAYLAGYDWGGRAACIMAATNPERVLGLITGGGYNIQKIEGSSEPLSPEAEKRYWYQYYLHGERGRRGFEKHRNDFCRILWRDWSPTWSFDEETYQNTAKCFENPDFVDVVVHSYRHRFGLVAGDLRYRGLSQALEMLPCINVPTMAIEGGRDGVTPLGSYSRFDGKFTGRFERRVLANAGHNLPQEDPVGFLKAIVDIAEW